MGDGRLSEPRRQRAVGSEPRGCRRVYCGVDLGFTEQRERAGQQDGDALERILDSRRRV